MPYKTEDGRIFDNQNDAQNYANNLAAVRDAENRAASLARSNRIGDYNNLLGLFNKRDWSGIIEYYEKNKWNLQYSFMQTPHAGRVRTLAEAVINNDYVLAFLMGEWGEPYTRDERENGQIICRCAMEEGKKIWEKQNGRAMTDADLKQVRIDYVEKELADFAGKRGYCGASDAKDWEELNGRKITKEDMIRITGKPLKIGEGYSSSSKSSSSSASTYGDQRGVFLSIVFALVCGLGSFLTLKMIFNLLSGNGVNIITIGALIFGFIITFIAWRNRKNVLFVLMLVIGVVGYLNLFGIIGNKTPKAKTETTQSANTNPSAEITKNVNFRKGPSTNDEVIRQLKQGDIVILTGEVSGGWTQVTRDGEKGWVSNEYLKVWEK